jgi:hypothetical protein
MPRKKRGNEFLAYILQCFLQDQEEALSFYLLWVCTTHDSIVDELSKRPPTERERKYYQQGRLTVLAHILFAMKSFLNMKPQKNRAEDPPSSYLLA